MISPTSNPASRSGLSRRWVRLGLLCAGLGPGLMVMLADTDAGSIVTAAQSGARWGYSLVLPEILLIPAVYLIQEITIRLGLGTGKGHGALIRERFGWPWAVLSVTTLLLSAIGALVTEFSGIAGVGSLFGIDPRLSVSIATGILILLGLSGNYRRVERIGVAAGLFELLLIPAAIFAHPHAAQLYHGVTSIPAGHPSYRWLLAANVGAVIMPWMIFYQQSAVLDKGLIPTQALHARWDTAVGAILTQLVMIAVVIMIAATIGRVHPHQSLPTIQAIAKGLIPFLGHWGANVVFGLGVLGASFIAALVVSLAAAWGLGEVFGFGHSLNAPVHQAKGFYLIYTLIHIGGAMLIFSGINLVRIDVDTEIMNAMLLPVVLGFLLILEARALPFHWRMRGLHKFVAWALSAAIIGFALYTGVQLIA